MKKSLVFIGGWSRDKSSYSSLFRTKPDGVDIHFIESKAVDLSDIGYCIDVFMEDNQIERADLVGHSVGGAIAMEYAADSPDKVKRLILIDAEGIPGSEKFQQLLVNFSKTQIKHGHRKITANARSVLNLFRSPASGLRFARHAHNSDVREKLKKIGVPTLIIWGEKDSLTPLWQGNLIHEGISGSKLIVLGNMDHDWILHRPELFWENI